MKAATKLKAGVTLAPMSATAAELLHRLQQEAADAAAPAPGTITLQPAAPLQMSRGSDDTYFAAYSADFNTHVTLLQYHHGRQNKWRGNESRTDTEGRRWERTLSMVINDFGDLVEVEP